MIEREGLGRARKEPEHSSRGQAGPRFTLPVGKGLGAPGRVPGLPLSVVLNRPRALPAPARFARTPTPVLTRFVPGKFVKKGFLHPEA